MEITREQPVGQQALIIQRTCDANFAEQGAIEMQSASLPMSETLPADGSRRNLGGAELVEPLVGWLPKTSLVDGSEKPGSYLRSLFGC